MWQCALCPLVRLALQSGVFFGVLLSNNIIILLTVYKLLRTCLVDSVYDAAGL